MIAMVREIDAHTKMFNFILDSELTLTLLQNVPSKNPVRINTRYHDLEALVSMKTFVSRITDYNHGCRQQGLFVDRISITLIADRSEMETRESAETRT